MSDKLLSLFDGYEEQTAINLEKLNEMIQTITKQTKEVQLMPIIDSRLIINTIIEIANQYNIVVKTTLQKIERLKNKQHNEQLTEILTDIKALSEVGIELSRLTILLQDFQGAMAKVSANADLEREVLTKISKKLDTM